MRFLAPIAAVVALALPVYGQSADEPVVVELYTSQGCSSCPPADALLHELAAREDVLPLALHVDYWDYIGWKDEFAKPSHTKRQKGYAHQGGRRMIYTPQMIIMGQDDVVGADAMKVEDAIIRHQKQPRPVALTVARSGGDVVIRLQPKVQMPEGRLLVQLVRYTPKRTVSIKRGELAGRTLSYANVVEDWQVVAEWDGAGGLEVAVPAPVGKPAAVLVQAAPFGPVIAAARVD
ncbi:MULTISPECIES: DUF1223 domain-containing protein [unclassified Leisingera]|uniref:DUF1223 domain-containing protein n=1 Tax=unclassified Leisingera TaxID=2614906 RepID=UPI0003818DB4|nr:MULTISPECIES: DUF1223 domain-containing protein [unclassified Leisingera]KIC25433.1 hypothetical protein RA23_06115 [Leisingera sp. ANG-S3]KIC30090.1 hypothetical protein RA24_03900 [Leisingera sp. ANG-M6]KIC54462.1 hypothetical protein RA22_07430 [Leisingera sp. ANG-S]KID10717.1 hypothetical protein GC1_03325 [Leisingera sp. ANG1]